ncbi:pilus assembly FimT family protein [Alkalimarinus alittae]|uniref:Prepilin-type N-terminal cleavage/methylation domain-containing protein n=1 Tax=Alkalimarinus alittae TaxID=2961619 RepID=A0ABY6N107_9ALTE|nr:prepilin-type N-terminal cleavage/methylation domain-containing protein [Alkalimarinus alittae]UZE95780.1 prepilin-type N-terminal cleavage/methylation domain-containing protein [Alkalimarinus alittae]
MKQMLLSEKHKGFTLIELVVVIAILAILSAFAIPRFADMADEAHRSSVEASGGALVSAVVLVRSQWLAKGNSVAVDDLEGYGDETIDTSVDGWPTGVGGNNNPGAMSAAECQNLWIKLLQSSAPSVSTAVGSDYLASTFGGDCRYTYQRDTSGNYVQYDPDTGEVITVIN